VIRDGDLEVTERTGDRSVAASAVLRDLTTASVIPPTERHELERVFTVTTGHRRL
jgi:hypothetical protein